jgi:hypothetical protein
MELIILLVVVGTSIWVVADASHIGVRKGLVTGVCDMGPAGWVIACLLLWIVAFPMYLAKRAAFVEAIAREKGADERVHAANAQRNAAPRHLDIRRAAAQVPACPDCQAPLPIPARPGSFQCQRCGCVLDAVEA